MERERDLHARDYGLPTERPAKRRHRSAVACQRCKSRKQRCDNDFPSCSNCVSARENCMYGDSQMYPAEYVRSLESQIAQLKAAMAAQERNSVSAGNQQNGVGGVGDVGDVSDLGRPSMRASTNASPENTVDEELEPCLEIGVGFVALSPNSYLGTSSGFPLAKLIKSALNVPSQAPFRPEVTARAGPDALMSSLSPSAPSTTARQQDRGRAVVAQADMPSDQIANKLIEAYFAHHTAALSDIDAILNVQSLENLEALLLLSIYQLRSPTGPGIW
ncbi:MAG: hypothetical protein STHCBS139747_003079 [Sporothrix thermara]